MNWRFIRFVPFVDTRAAFASKVPSSGSLLDIGSSNGETLCHMNELRPDLKFHATDIEGAPEQYPYGCEFHRGDIQTSSLPWKSESMDAVTCLQLMEHIDKRENLISEVHRLLVPGGRFLVEIPHPKTVTLDSPPGEWVGTFTLNFYDDISHIQPLSIGRVAYQLRNHGFKIVSSGTSRNWIFAILYPFYCFGPFGRKRFTSYAHFIGWSSYLVAVKD